MRRLIGLASTIARQARRLIHTAEAACGNDTALREAAAEVYVGDIYALRLGVRGRGDGWGKRCYVCAVERPIL